MFKVFLPKDAFINLFMEMAGKPESVQSDWYKILRKQKDVYFSGYQEDEELDPKSELYSISMSAGNGKVFHDETSYINSLPSSPEKTLENPCGAFLLNVDEATAKRIQDNYGVICQSVSNLDKCILAQFVDPEDLEDGESISSWHRLLTPLKKCPSNSLIVIDRNMFANEQYQILADGSKTTIGMENMFSILNELLPQQFSNVYHVLLITDADTLSPHGRANGRTFADLAKDFSNLNSRLRRNYTIAYEVVSILESSEFYKPTHNRRIIGNYYMVKAEHMLRAFNLNGKSLSSQTITPCFLFSTGLAPGKFPPVKGYTKIQNDIHELIQTWKESPDGHPELQYAVNGKGNKSITEFKNRIICNFS